MKYVIIGGGIAGTTAAEIIRKEDPQGEIFLIGKEKYPLYARLILRSYLKNEIKREQLFMKNQEWYEQNKINPIFGVTAAAVDFLKKEVLLSNGEKLDYDKLLIATGGSPNKLEIPGYELEGVYNLQTLDDADKVYEHLKNSKNAVILGGGFIGLDYAGVFRKANLKTTMIVREKWYWSKLLDETSGRLIEDQLQKNGIDVLLEEEVREIYGDQKIEGVKTFQNKDLECDILGVGIGIKPNLNFSNGSNIEIQSGIITNEYLESNIKEVFAAGDVAEFYDVILGERHRLGNWTNSMMQGKIAGLNMVGKKTVFETISAYSQDIFGMNITFMGDVLHSQNVAPAFALPSPKAADGHSKATAGRQGFLVPRSSARSEVGSPAQIITRGSKAEQKYARIILNEDGFCLGATLINYQELLAPLQKIIKEKVKFQETKI